MSSDHRDGGKIRFFFHLNNQTSLYRWLYQNMRKTNVVFFESIRWWSVINLVTLIHGYSYLISLEIDVGYRKLIIFQGTQANLIVLLEKLDVNYPLRNS